jgi:hypothetical protein
VTFIFSHFVADEALDAPTAFIWIEALRSPALTQVLAPPGILASEVTTNR